MTVEDSRRVLQEIWRGERNDYQSTEFLEALDRAIKTLERYSEIKKMEENKT